LLDHDHFVATVTGHAPTEDWAESVVAGLLDEDATRGAPTRLASPGDERRNGRA
jgi:hypothetical protein